MLTKNKKITAIDLFAGIGGMRMGFEQAGYEIVYSNDVDKYSCKTYKTNFGEIDERDIRDVKAEELPNFDVLLGGFPCQPFSMIGKRDGLADPRGRLFSEIVRILNVRKPKAFVLENVRNLIRHNRGDTFNHIKNELEKAGGGYSIFYEVLNSKNFGVPQQRERTYIVGLKKAVAAFVFPQKGKYIRAKTLGDVLEKSVLEKHYLTEKYYKGLLNHKKRHNEKGSGFGCAIVNPEGISNTLVCGNMGRERNLIKDVPTGKNRWGIRKLTPRECARLQGFPDTFKIPVSDTQAYKQFGNAVSVPVAKEIAIALKDHLSGRINISPSRESAIKSLLFESPLYTS
jgi:DNA (cytosine-5)-methyltransferase 1